MIMVQEKDNAYEPIEDNLMADSRLVSATEPYLLLDTIEEAKESSLSGESTDFTTEDSLHYEHESEVKEEKTEKEVIPNKIKIQWMNEDDDEDDFENIEDKWKDTLQSYLSHPDVDKGWAWVVLFAMFFLFSIQAGLLASTGLYYQQMLQEFRHSRSYTAWLGSLMNAFFMLAGPLSSIFINKAGCRASIVLGSILMTIGYLASAFAPSLMFIFLSYGIFVGMSVILSITLPLRIMLS